MSPWLSSLLTSVLAKVLARKIELLLAASWGSVLAVTISARHYLAQFVPLPADEWAVLTTGAALAALLTVAFVYFWFRPKFEPTSWGSHKNIKTGTYYCSVCLIPNKIHSPMFLSSDGRRWICHSKLQSNHYVQNPEFKEPEPSPSPPRDAQLWMGN